MKTNVRIALSLSLVLALILGIAGPITIWWLKARMSAAARDRYPTLDKDQLRALPTHMRKCRRTLDCDYPLICTLGPKGVGGWRCRASECETDLQCEPGFVCATLQGIDMPPIRFCLVRGIRAEGEKCTEIYQKEKHGCQPGLLCRWGLCGRPCDADAPSACPDGFVCHQGPIPPICLPSCLRTGCPEGQQCIRMDGEYSVCGHVLGQDCDKHPCPPGEKCQRELTHRLQSQMVKMWCAVPCDRLDGGVCPAGFTCLYDDCARLCDEQDAGSCPPGQACNRILDPDGNFGACDLKE